jgi:hypothetical protein
MLKISPTALNFGDKTEEGKTSKSKSVKITNESSNSSKIDVMVTGETTASPFTVKTACDKTLAPKKDCEVKVTFTAPMDTTPQNGELIINDNGADAPQMVSLTGTGKAPKAK